ncbi:MAG: DNA alkylation repair protein [Promethearchaeota archaeon]
MATIENILTQIRKELQDNAPLLGEEEKKRFYKILNSENPDFTSYGFKIPEIENFARSFHQVYGLTLKEGVKLFNHLMRSNVHNEKFLGVFIINRFKKDFKPSIVKTFYDAFIAYCDTRALCDSSMIRVVGPFLGKKSNEKLAREMVNKWSNSENMWIRRASLVILIKITMINKDFDKDQIYDIVDRMRDSTEDYIHKGIVWLLKTCSTYEPDLILEYLMENKKNLSRLILQYDCEKIPKEKKKKILEKSK